MLQNKSIYFPALSLSINLDPIKKNYKHMKTGKNFNFLKEDSMFYHPYMLISAGHNYKKDLKTKVGYDLNTTKVLGDSGGYQIASEKLVLTDQLREDLFNWLENNTNYAINLDIPPYGAYSNRKASDFKTNTKISVENFKYFQEHQSGKTKYLNVLHGRGLEDLNYWYNEIKGFNFSGGWSIGSVFGNIFYMLLSFFYLWERKEIQKFHDTDAIIHFLGFSRNSSLFVILYLQEKLNELGINIRISYDSSSPFMMAGYGKFALFSKKTGVSVIDISNKIMKDKEFINMEANLFCNCPVCEQMTIGDLFSFWKEDHFTSEIYYYLGNHNLYAFLNYKSLMENFLLTANKSLYESLFTQKEMQLLNVINTAFKSRNSTKIIWDNRSLLAELLDEPEIIKNSFF